MVNPAPHTASGDALSTGQAAATMLAMCADYGVDDITPLLAAPLAGGERSGAPRSEDDELDLTPEHREVHAQPLIGSRKARIASLSYCLDVSCRNFPYRVEDAIVNAGKARELATWCTELLADHTLTRIQAGLVAGALGRTLRHLREDPDAVIGRYNAVRPDLNHWGYCDPSDPCDRCADERTCRFVRVRQRFASAVIYDDDGHLSLDRAARFLPIDAPGTPPKRGRKPTGWFGQLVRAGDVHAAAHGAVLCARARTTLRERTWVLATLERAWNAGLRSPSLAYQYSTAIERDAGKKAADKLTLLHRICDDAITAGPGPDRYYWTRLQARHLRLAQRLAASTAPPRPTGRVSARCHAEQPVGPRNSRTAWDNPYAV